MPIPATVFRATVHRVGIGQLQQVNLLIAHPEPGPGKRQVRTLQFRQTQYVPVEAQRTGRVGHHQARMMDAEKLSTHDSGTGSIPGAGRPSMLTAFLRRW